MTLETSEQAVEQARQQAEEIVAGARKQAEEILDAARTQVSGGRGPLGGDSSGDHWLSAPHAHAAK